MNRLAAILVPPVMGLIADWWGATLSFVVLGGFLILLCLPIVWITRRTPKTSAAAEEAPKPS